MHFLWKQIAEANQHKRRVIFEHIRDRVPEMTGYLFENLLCSNSFYISQPDKFFVLSVEEQIKLLLSKFLLENKKTLMNVIYIIKAFITVFKNYLRNENKQMTKLVNIIRCLIELVYTNKIDKIIN